MEEREELPIKEYKWAFLDRINLDFSMAQGYHPWCFMYANPWELSEQIERSMMEYIRIR